MDGSAKRALSDEAASLSIMFRVPFQVGGPSGFEDIGLPGGMWHQASGETMMLTANGTSQTGSDPVQLHGTNHCPTMMIVRYGLT